MLAARAQSLNRQTKVFLCDTFSGVVKAGALDNFYKGGEHADTSKDLVVGLANSLGLDNVEILEGIFPEDTGDVVGRNTFCFCHIDVDVYQSAKDVVNWVWPRLRVGGVIVFDDYGFHHCQGITQLVDELAGRKDNLMLNNLNGHAVLVRRE